MALDFGSMPSHSRSKTSGTAERCVSMISRLFHSHTTSFTIPIICNCWKMREHDFKIISQPYTTLPMTENICNCWNMCEHDFKIISKPYDLMTENIWNCWKMCEHDFKIISQSYDLTCDRKHLELLKDAWALFSRLFHSHIGSHSWTKTSGTAERCVSMISRLFQSHMTSWLKRWLFSRIHSQ